jgi:hypothetical protein
MNTHADKKQKKKSQSVSNAVSQKREVGSSTFQFKDNRPIAIAQRKLQEMVNNSPRSMQMKAFQDMANSHSPIQLMNRAFTSRIVPRFKPKPMMLTKPKPMPTYPSMRDQLDQNQFRPPAFKVMMAAHDSYSASIQTPEVEQTIEQLTSPLLRGDDAPEAEVTQNEWKTPKSSVKNGVLTPVNADGETTISEHIDGVPIKKSDSPYTSTTTNLSVAKMYGRQTIETSPDLSQIYPTSFLIDAIGLEDNSDLGMTAMNRTAKPPTSWFPSTLKERAAAEELGMTDQQSYTYNQRAQINTQKDKEVLVKGSTPAKVRPSPVKDMPLMTKVD